MLTLLLAGTAAVGTVTVQDPNKVLCWGEAPAGSCVAVLCFRFKEFELAACGVIVRGPPEAAIDVVVLLEFTQPVPLAAEQRYTDMEGSGR